MFVEQENRLNETNSQAEINCRKALADAGFGCPASTSFHWSQLINPNGERIAAINAYLLLLDQEKSSKSALEGLAYLYQLMGHQKHAKYFRRKLKEIEVEEYGIRQSASREVVEYLLAKTGESSMPDRVPFDFVTAHFDRYSTSFDSSLLDDLSYNGPILIRQEVESFYSKQDSEKLKVLDIGCGTGLVGKLLTSFFDTLVGVDLSSEMLKIADKRNCYQKLVRSDCVSFLEDNNEKFDLVSAADVLNYTGDLSFLFKAVRRSLKKNGIFVFTIEHADTADYRLSNTGRFQHGAHYIRQLAKKYHYHITVEKTVDLRKERDDIVKAKLFTLKC